MTALTRGGLHSSFWIVDRKHIYVGSAGMDWRSLFKVTGKCFGGRVTSAPLGGGPFSRGPQMALL